MDRFISTARALLIPASILLAAHMSLPYLRATPSSFHVLFPIAPYAACALAAALGLLFAQGRVLITATLLALAMGAVDMIVATAVDDPFHAAAVFTGATILLPINLMVFSSLPERGTLNQYAALRLAAIGAQIGAIAWIVYAQRADILQWLTTQHLRAIYPALPLPDLALVAFVIGSLALLLRLWRHGTPLESGSLVILLALGLAFTRAGLFAVPQAYITAAALILTASLVLNAHHIAFRDELTGLPARRALVQRLASLGRRYTIAMLDVDHFKRFNDTYGHDVGDQVLRMVASRIRTVGGGGKAFRYGGEEFTIVFPGKSVDEALPYLEAVRETIANYDMVLRDANRPADKSGKQQRGSGSTKRKTVNVTISIGVASRSKTLRTPDEVIKAADEALYRAKNAGRNRVSE